MTATPTPSPLTATQLVDEYFIENRNRLIEIAAFLDRIDRADPEATSSDFRMRAFASALGVLLGASPTRVADIQVLLSDPRTDPLPALDRKGAVGAYDAAAAGAR